jgi:ribosomal protein S18 acetylase RimI-like enzyme
MKTRAKRRMMIVLPYPAVHPLDNSAWHALHGPQRRFGEGAGAAVRYDPQVAVFAALPDEPTPEAWEALRELVGPGQLAVLFRDVVVAPPEWKELFRLPTLQMLAGASAAGTTAAEREYAIEPLGAGDAAEMLGLAERARPGPFSLRTHELGHFHGIRDGGKLVAMAGERMHPPGHVEISAVSTEETHRGRGLAAALIRVLLADIAARGHVPFLHVAADNTTAIRLYEHLGFTTRRHVEAVGLLTPK